RYLLKLLCGGHPEPPRVEAVTQIANEAAPLVKPASARERSALRACGRPSAFVERNLARFRSKAGYDLGDVMSRDLLLVNSDSVGDPARFRSVDELESAFAELG